MERTTTRTSEVGDGDGEFLPDMTDAEYAAHVREVDHGWRPFYDKVLGRTRAPQSIDLEKDSA